MHSWSVYIFFLCRKRNTHIYHFLKKYPVVFHGRVRPSSSFAWLPTHLFQNLPCNSKQLKDMLLSRVKNVPLDFWSFFLNASWNLLSGSPPLKGLPVWSFFIVEIVSDVWCRAAEGRLLVQLWMLPAAGCLSIRELGPHLLFQSIIRFTELGDLVNDSRYKNQRGINFLKKCVSCINCDHLSLLCNYVYLDHHLYSYGYGVCITAVFWAALKATNRLLAEGMWLLSQESLNQATRILSAAWYGPSWCCKSSVTCNMGDSGFPYVHSSHGAEISDSQVMVNDALRIHPLELGRLHRGLWSRSS